MSKLAALDGLLELYYQLNYHKNPEIYQRLQDVQAWQKLRMQRTHARHFAEKQNALMAASVRALLPCILRMPQWKPVCACCWSIWTSRAVRL